MQIKTLHSILVFIVLIVVTTVGVISFFETKANAQIKYSELNIKIENVRKDTETVRSILCATAIDNNWPTVKMACGIQENGG